MSLRAPIVSPECVRFSEMTPEWANRDMQLHTNWTDGIPSIKEVVAQAERIGLGAIAFTEHVRSDSEWFPDFAAKVREAGQGSRVRVLVGAEAAIIDEEGTVNISPLIRELSDFVIASVHRFPAADGSLMAFKDVPREEFADREFRLAMGLLRHGSADVLSHPGGMSLAQTGNFPPELYLQLMEAACECGIAIEINSFYTKDLGPFLDLLRQSDPPVSLGSDAHKLEDLGKCRDQVRSILWGS